MQASGMSNRSLAVAILSTIGLAVNWLIGRAERALLAWRR